jgi:hypothetical protein
VHRPTAPVASGSLLFLERGPRDVGFVFTRHSNAPLADFRVKSFPNFQVAPTL